MTETKTLRMVSESVCVPEELKELDVWTVWDCVDKTPRAPWQTGHMFPAKWGQAVPEDDRPETNFEQANMVSEMDPETIHQTWPFPRNDDGQVEYPDDIKPGIILPHDPGPGLPLMFVDFDDVRDPETGEVSPEVAELVDELGAYTEISRSGAGLHCYVFAELPGSLGKFIADLDDEGHIELYDHGRFTGGTWQHVTGTPMEIPECQEAVDDILQRYEDDGQRRRRKREPHDSEDYDRDIDDILAELRNDSSGEGNAYFRLDVEQVANCGHFRHHAQSGSREWKNGPHPGHGPKHSDPADCTNFGVNTGENYWKCFLHDSGGSALHLIAVLEGVVSCSNTDVLTRRPRALLETCLHARDSYASSDLEGEDPPYDALVAIARQHDLAMADADAGKLGKDAWRIARLIYEEMSAADVE